MKSLIQVLALSLILCGSSIASDISIGMKIDQVRTELGEKKFPYGNKYQLSIHSADQNIRQEFCVIDNDITLVIEYDKTTEEVTSLILYFIPDNRSKKDQVVVRKISSLKLLEAKKISVQLELNK